MTLVIERGMTVEEGVTWNPWVSEFDLQHFSMNSILVDDIFSTNYGKRRQLMFAFKTEIEDNGEVGDTGSSFNYTAREISEKHWLSCGMIVLESTDDEVMHCPYCHKEI
jgi:hypothetical protein